MHKQGCRYQFSWSIGKKIYKIKCIPIFVQLAFQTHDLCTSTIGTWSNHHRNIIILIHKNISRHLGISFNYFFSPEPIAHCAKSNDTPVKKDASLKNCCLPSILNSKLHLLLASFLVVVVHTTSPFFPRQIYRSHAKHARNRDWGTGKAHIFCSLKHFFGACCTL